MQGLTEDLFELSADIVIVGSGAAATTAAMTAANEGQEVLILEAADAIGGTTALSGCGAWVPNNRYIRELGLEDPREPLLRFLASVAYPDQYDPSSPTLGLLPDAYELIATYYDRGSEAIDYIVDAGATTFFADVDTPDYHYFHPDNKVPQGRLLKPPERKIGHDGAADAHLGRMLKFVEDRGGSVRTNHRAVGLLRNEDDEVVGLEVRAGLRTILVRARKAVIFGTGGFLHNAEKRKEYLMGPTYGGCATPSAQGDFIDIGTEVGASLGLMSQAWWYQVALEQVMDSSVVTRGLTMPFGDAMIQVNKYGRRVMNEKLPYNERGPLHFLWDGTEYRNLVLFSIFDDEVLDIPDKTHRRLPVPQRGEDVHYLISGDTFDELVVGIEKHLEKVKHVTGGFTLGDSFLENLKHSVKRFNGFAENGVDEDFGRGEDPISMVWSQPHRDKAKKTMAPFTEQGPYHCILLVAGALDTKGGPKINTKAQVIDGRKNPIPGLYGAGNCVASPTGRSYWGPGATIGSAMIYGYIAGREAAQESVKKL